MQATAIPHHSPGRRKCPFWGAEVLCCLDYPQHYLVYLLEYMAMISLIQRVCHAVLTQEKWALVTHRLTLRFSAIFKPSQVPQIRHVRILSANKFVLDEWMVRLLDIVTVKIMAISLGIVWPFIIRDVPLIRWDSSAPWRPATLRWHWCCAHFLKTSTKWQNLKCVYATLFRHSIICLN